MRFAGCTRRAALTKSLVRIRSCVFSSSCLPICLQLTEFIDHKTQCRVILFGLVQLEFTAGGIFDVVTLIGTADH